MSKICTSIEQSKRLIELGLSVETSDMYWDFQIDSYVLIADGLGYYNNDSEVPSWSLSALLELIPNYTMDKTDKINLVCNPDYHWESCYDTPLDAAYEMICWLLEEKKI